MASITKGATTIVFQSVLYPADYDGSRHQNFGVAENGKARVYDRSVKEELIKREIKADATTRSALRTFFMDTVKLRFDTFTFTPDAADDAGAGVGVAVTVRYWSSNFVESNYVYYHQKYQLTLRPEIP